MDRQKPSEPRTTIPGPQPQARRNRNWEIEQRSRPGLCQISFRGIPDIIRDELLFIARSYRLPNRDEVARVWLEHALAAHRRGEIDYPPTKVSENGKLTFYPDENEL